MARARIVTKLPLDEWARLMGVDPLHFNQVEIPSTRESPGLCDLAWYQHEWQDVDRVGRESVAFAIQQAESLLERAFRFRLIPTWEADEWRPTARSTRPELFGNGFNSRGLRASVEAGWGYFMQPGIRAKTLIEAATPITYSPDGEDLEDTEYAEVATITVTVPAGTSACELSVYYPEKEAADAWEIRPITVVSLIGTTATITFRREQAVDAELLEERDPEPVDGMEDNNFLEAVDVYRVWNNPATQATLMWEPTGGCGCAADTCAQCSYSTQSGCLYGQGEPRDSFVAYRPASWNAETSAFDVAPMAWARQPEIVRMWYRAGWRDMSLECPTRTMDPDMARNVAILAASLLDRPPCGCAALEARINRYRRDLAFAGGAEEFAEYRLRELDLANPLGTTAGAIEVWRWVRSSELQIAGVSPHA